MYKKYLFLALGFLVVGGALFFFLSNRTPKPLAEVSVVKGGWVEIVSGKVFLVSNPGASEAKTEIISGATVVKDNILETSDKGNAVIHFFDGSVLRMSSNTRLVIKDAEYDKNSGKLTVRASLLFGKVWSKIIELATPDSLWQVETSNTVATVRGTAFGVSSDGKNSEIFGSQHSVSVAFIDPKTQVKLKTQSSIVSEGVLLKVTESDIEKIKKVEENTNIVSSILDSLTSSSSAMIVPLAEISEEIRSDAWFSENEDEDKKIEDEVVKIKETTHSDRMELKKVLDQKTEERFFETVKKEQEREKDKEREREKKVESISSIGTIESMSSSTEESLLSKRILEQVLKGKDKQEETREEEIRTASTTEVELREVSGVGTSNTTMSGGSGSVITEGTHANTESTERSTTVGSSGVSQVAPTSVSTKTEEHTSVRTETSSTAPKNESHSDDRR